ncbi:hypothetical protein OUZ56_012606 [Daphnia magna]|uniref:Uncharacterized protein n=1 Tax=Daphnia magna TaxID=35525 RepID=A0ABQ9Z3N1_9CRUS|nr:hypothetical protein OUZ56_012606 [Daphnia magna]
MVNKKKWIKLKRSLETTPMMAVNKKWPALTPIWNTSPIISYEATRKTNQAVDGVNCLFQNIVKNRIDPYGCKILLLEENIKQCSGKTTEANFNVNLIDLGSDPESVSNEVDDASLANTIFQALA